MLSRYLEIVIMCNCALYTLMSSLAKFSLDFEGTALFPPKSSEIYHHHRIMWRVSSGNFDNDLTRLFVQASEVNPKFAVDVSSSLSESVAIAPSAIGFLGVRRCRESMKLIKKEEPARDNIVWDIVFWVFLKGWWGPMGWSPLHSARFLRSLWGLLVVEQHLWLQHIRHQQDNIALGMLYLHK